MPYYDLGDPVPLTVTVRDSERNPVVPATATLTVEQPDGTTVSPTLTLAIPLAYDFSATMVGRHAYRFTSTGPQAAFTDVFDVRPAFSSGIIGLADAREQLNFDANTSDEEVRSLIESATEIIERHTAEVVVRRTVTDYLSGSGSQLWLRRKPVISLTSIATTDAVTSWLPADFDLDPGLGRLTLTTGRLYGDLSVTYVAGYQVIPARYIDAAKAIVQHLWSTQRSDAGSPQVGGMDTPGEGFTSFGSPLTTLVRALLGPPPPMVA